MADIPSISTLKTQIENDIKTSYGITKSWVGKVFLKSIATVWAGIVKLMYLRIAFVQKNIFIDTADPESVGGTLSRFGRIKLGRDIAPAVAGIYTLDVTGSAGGVIPKDTIFKSTVNSSSSGYAFSVEVDVTLAGSTGQVSVRALTSGSESALTVGDELELTSPITNVDAIALVASVDTTAVDAESVETYRRLGEEAFRLEPQGGSTTDYRLWAADVQGVRTVYTYARNGDPYQVDIYVEANTADSKAGEAEGVPPDSMLNDVLTAVETDPDTGRQRRPVNHWVEALSVVPVDVDINISDLSDKSASTLALIEAGLKDLFFDIRPYIAGADGTNNRSILTLGAVITKIFDVIPSGVTFTNVTMTIQGSSVTSFTFGSIPATYGSYPWLNNLTAP